MTTVGIYVGLSLVNLIHIYIIISVRETTIVIILNGDKLRQVAKGHCGLAGVVIDEETYAVINAKRVATKR
jgi:hypothetical protein